MKFLKLLIFPFIFLVLSLSSDAAYAQEEIEPAYYIVQEGDTLYGIANRFGISIEDISNLNPEVASLGLFSGDKLYLPGYEWLKGELAFFLIDDKSANLNSLSADLGISKETISSLNGITSPIQLLQGRNILIPIDLVNLNDDIQLDSASTSDLGISVISDKNPWEQRLVSKKVSVLETIYHPISNYQRLPDELDYLIVYPEALYQGEMFISFFRSGMEIDRISAYLDKHELAYFKDPEGNYLSMQGVEVVLEPGLYSFQIKIEWAEGKQFIHEHLVRVEQGNYRLENLTVDQDLTGLDVGLQERELLQTAMEYSSELKLWSEFFHYPTKDPDEVTSFFGTKRSLNGSGYDYFHGGIDYSGYVGEEIFAASDGIIVFAGEMPIRGNATMIDHGWGIFTLYGHQSEFLVAVGDYVEAGQVIGLIGNTGRSSGPHVHWEVWANGVQTNPHYWIYKPFPYVVDLPD